MIQPPVKFALEATLTGSAAPPSSPLEGLSLFNREVQFDLGFNHHTVYSTANNVPLEGRQQANLC